MTGQEALAAHRDNWHGFEASHIFPIAYEAYWTAHNFSRWITIIPERGGSINSVQNGLLLRSDIHQLFDSYDFAINPDVCAHLLGMRDAANNYLRIPTRLFFSPRICMISLERTWIGGSSMTLKDPSTSSFDGTFDRRYL